ncbi:hypothetical protein ACEQPO_29985 [Bacillus sp. SL00103]
MISIAGANGAGKTTLSKCSARLKSQQRDHSSKW